VLNKIKIYGYEIWFLAGAQIHMLLSIFLLFFIIGIFDLIGLSLIGQYVSLALGSMQIPSIFNYILPYLSLKQISTALVFVFAVKFGLGTWANKNIYMLAAKVEVNLRVELLKRYQNMPYQSWAARNSSDYISAINIWAPQYSRLVLLVLLRLAAEILIAFFILGFLFFVDPYVFFTLISLIGSSTLLYYNFLRQKNRFYADQFKKFSSLVITDVRQAMDGIKEIRVLGAENFFIDRIAGNGEALSFSQASSNSISSSARYFLEFAVVLFAILVPLVLSKNSHNL